MAEEVEQSQPASNARDIVAKHLAELAPEPEEAPQTQAEPEPESFDPATIKIPNRQFVTNVPKALEKFKDKTLVDLATSYEEAEKAMHAKSEEAAKTRRENEELKTRLAAAEQFARMTQAPATEPTDPYTRAGINIDEAIITDPKRVMGTTLDESRRIAREEAQRAAKDVQEQSRAEQKQQRDADELLTAFELARTETGKLVGKEFSVPEWQAELEDIARLVQAREPARIKDHKAYVETYVRLRGVPKVTVPAEGNPPVAAKPAQVKSERAVPTMSREEQLLNKQIRRALKLET